LGVAEIPLARGDALCLIYRHIVHTEKGEFVIDRVEFIIYCLLSLQCSNINNALIYQGTLVWVSHSSKGYALFHPQNIFAWNTS